MNILVVSIIQNVSEFTEISETLDFGLKHASNKLDHLQPHTILMLMHPSIKAVIFGLDFHTGTEGVNRPSLKVNKAETWSVAFIFLVSLYPLPTNLGITSECKITKETYFPH